MIRSSTNVNNYKGEGGGLTVTYRVVLSTFTLRLIGKNPNIVLPEILNDAQHKLRKEMLKLENSYGRAHGEGAEETNPVTEPPA